MQTRKPKKYDSAVWLAAALLAILLLITWALLAAMLGAHAAPQDTIALTPGQSKNALYQTFYRSVQGTPGMTTQDDTATWETTTDVDLFKSSYTNAQGRVSVKSADGRNVVAPGTTGTYTFSIRNTGNTVLAYTVSMESAFTLSDNSIPMQFRLRRGADWLVGGEGEWCTLQTLNAYTGDSTLNPEKIDEYQLEWQWPFEGDNAADTRLGSITVNAAAGTAAAAADADFKLTIITTAETAENAPAVNADGDLLVQPLFTPRTLALLVLDLAVLAALLLLLLWRRRVYVCGYTPAAAGAALYCGRKKCAVLPGGGFAFPRVYTGRRTLTLPDGKLTWRLKRKGSVQGVQFAADNTVCLGRGVRAVELYLVQTADGPRFDTTRWAAIDSRNNVYTPGGVQAPDENGCNATPGGLTADKHKKYAFRTHEKAV